MKTYKFVLNSLDLEVIERRGYTGKGYRYSLKLFDNDHKEIYYSDSIKSSKTQIKQDKLMVLAMKHLKDMEVI